jgi:CheY-like chemotaxis protein
MDSNQAYAILQEIVASLASRGEKVKPLGTGIQRETTLEELGLDLFAFSEIVDELGQRFNGRNFHLNSFMVPEEYYHLTLGRFLDLVTQAFRPSHANPVIVYVDDEEENLFIFKRKYGKSLNLKTFTDPMQALAFIRTSSEVALVITDEVMPGLSGNALCDEVTKTKPNMKFILITGNPNNDGDLMYKSLRHSRFFEFLNKPLDLDRDGERYLKIIRDLVGAPAEKQ